MEKGPSRSWARPVAGAAYLLGLVAATALIHGQPPSPSKKPWWDVRLAVAVRGEYAIRGAEVPVSGTFAYRARWTGRLELDRDGDFLLVRLGAEVLEWRLRETAWTGGRESVREVPPVPKPVLRLNYLFKDGDDVEFDFGVDHPFTIPLHALSLSAALELPRSAAVRTPVPGEPYGECVCRGSCRIAIPGQDLVEARPERRFSWDWRRERKHFHGGRIVTETQRHTAEAVVTVVPR